MSMVDEFKAFIARGNVLDLAVAVVIGAAFGKIVTAMVDVAMGGVDFSQLFVSLDGNEYATLAAAQEAAAPVITYGAFIQTIIDFVLIAFVIFLIVRSYNRMRPPKADTPAPPSEDILLLREIRDSLKQRTP